MGRGIARQIAKIYPEVEAADYKYSTKYWVPELIYGTVLPVLTNDNRLCINMYAQYAPGGPCNGTFDDSNSREHAFQRCLDVLLEQIVSNTESSVKRTSIGFPKYIGCGIAKGDWNKYKAMIEDFERKLDSFNLNYKVYIINYEKEEETE
jgi:hypothetical protein